MPIVPLSAVLVGGAISSASTWLTDVSSTWWFLIVIFAIAVADSVIPAVPSETAVIIGGVAAGAGSQSLALVITAAALGAFVGDNIAYEIGRRAHSTVDRFVSTRPNWKKRLEWAEAQIGRRGGLLLVTARFVPGGRTAVTVSSGVTHQPYRWFVRWDGLAAVLWGTYAALLGFIGGRSFADNHTMAFLFAFVLALTATGVIEIVRHRFEKRAKARNPEPEKTSAP